VGLGTGFEKYLDKEVWIESIYGEVGGKVVHVGLEDLVIQQNGSLAGKMKFRYNTIIDIYLKGPKIRI